VTTCITYKTTIISSLFFTSIQLELSLYSVAHSYPLNTPTGGGLFIQNKNAKEKHKN
jgi:hypothetical protein